MLGKEMGYEISTCQKQYDLGNNRGGIDVFIKYESFPRVTAIDSDSDYIFWFMISTVFLKTDDLGQFMYPHRSRGLILKVSYMFIR